MTEAFIHYIWRTRRFDREALALADGTPVDILQFGNYNIGDGPDFSEGRVRIGDTLWAGHIEMHIKSSDWHHHRHQFDPGYDNVVLHVVWEDDEPVLNARGVALPTLIIADRVDAQLIGRYEELAANEHAIPCESHLDAVPDLVLSGWIERMMLQRLERKTGELHDLLVSKRSDWDAAFFHQLGRCLGLPLNAGAMDQLMEALPVNLLQRYRTDQVALEALLLGTAGLLEEDYLDEYPRQLRREYEHLAHKHKLRGLHRSIWNFRGLRPASFPTMRLVQLAAVLRVHPGVFQPFLDAVAETNPASQMTRLLECEPHPYWRSHYLPDRPSQERKKVIGKSAAQTVLINAVVPFLFLYGRLQGRSELEEAAIALLESLPAERNTIIKQWRSVGIVAENAAETQALLTLRKEYCQPRRCLECAIGHCQLKRARNRIVDFDRDRDRSQEQVVREACAPVVLELMPDISPYTNPEAVPMLAAESGSYEYGDMLAA